ncbi:Pentatricopeptide repeat-containing protein DOT4, chloroplastic, partial [Mucuna pruriens]
MDFCGDITNQALQLLGGTIRQLKPDDNTMACVLPTCAGLAALEKGRDTWAHIEKRDLISWTAMIAGYGMHGFGKEAISTFEKMRIAGIEPEESSFTSILYAYSHSKLLKEGWKFFSSMRSECNIEPKLEHYACMADLLVHSGNLSKAYKFIKTMPIKADATISGALLSGCRIHHDVELAEKVTEHIFELEPENTRYYVLLANVYAEAEKLEEVKKVKKKGR